MRAQENVGACSRPSSGRIVEPEKKEVADARRHLNPESGNRIGQPPQPSFAVLERRLNVRRVRQARGPYRDRRTVEMERPSHAVEGVQHVLRSKSPSISLDRQNFRPRLEMD